MSKLPKLMHSSPVAIEVEAEANVQFAPVTFGVLLLAAIKMRFIMTDFMEVRHAPLLLRRLTDG